MQVAGRRVWAVATSAHIAATTLSAAVLGLVVAAAGVALDVGRWQVALSAVGGSVLVVCALRDAGVIRCPLPSLDRQTPRWFRRQFSPLCWSFLWGLDLGQGWTTRILFTGYYGLIVVALLSANLAIGAGLLAVYGFGRGLPVLITGLFSRQPGHGRSGPSLAFNQAFLQYLNTAALAFTGMYLLFSWVKPA